MRVFTLVVALGVVGTGVLEAQKPQRASPTLLPPGAQPAPTTAGQPAATAPRDTSNKGTRSSPTMVSRPGVVTDSSRTAARNAAAAQSVAPQAARPSAAPVAAFTAGLGIEVYEGATDEARDTYLGQFTRQLDSAVVSLVAVFRGTTGQPLAGAEAPSALSARERDRWTRCRDLHFDLQSFATAMHEFTGNLPEEAAVGRAGHALDSALTALQATSGCDDVASMIMAPDRWTPWPSQYQSTARDFYRTWYPQVRDVADRNRALVIAVNATRPANARLQVPPGLPRNAPYAGAAPR